MASIKAYGEERGEWGTLVGKVGGKASGQVGVVLALPCLCKSSMTGDAVR